MVVEKTKIDTVFFLLLVICSNLVCLFYQRPFLQKGSFLDIIIPSCKNELLRVSWWYSQQVLRYHPRPKLAIYNIISTKFQIQRLNLITKQAPHIKKTDYQNKYSLFYLKTKSFCIYKKLQYTCKKHLHLLKNKKYGLNRLRTLKRQITRTNIFFFYEKILFHINKITT